MGDFKKKLAEIEDQVQQLIIKTKAYKAEKDNLYAENKRLRNLIDEQGQKIDELENKNLSLQLSRSIVHEKSDANSLKEQLEMYIQDIDKCLALLKANTDQKT